MLVLSRRIQESILINGGIKITIVNIRSGRVHLGIVAPANIKIFREELIHKDDCDDKSRRNIK